MKPRAVRISMVDSVVTFDRQAATLVNISRTGALLRLLESATLGTLGKMVLTHGHTTIEIEARVVRSVIAPSPGNAGEGDWHVGIVFVSPPPPEITALLRRLFSLG